MVTPLMHAALPKARAALITAAQLETTITYGQLTRAIEAYSPVGLGDLLDVLSVWCEQLDEPSLAPLAVNATTREVGGSLTGDAQWGRQDMWDFWARD